MLPSDADALKLIKYIYIITAAPAPEFIPKIPGSANSFFVIPWRNSPETESPIPINIAITILGSLNSNTTNLNFSLSFKLNKVWNTSITLISNIPLIICR